MGMGISSAGSSGGTAANSGVSAWQQRAQDFGALNKAIQSGSLSAAQSAYSTLTANAPAQATQDTNSPLAQIGKALQSGNIGAAQQVLQAMKSHGHRHGPHGGGGSLGSTGSSTPVASPPTATTGNNVNLVA